MKKRINYLLLFMLITVSPLQLGAVTHYQTVSAYLPQGKTVSRLSKQDDINNACNVAQSHLTNALRRAKAGSQERTTLIEKEKTVKEACTVLRNSEKRTVYHQQLDKGSLQKAAQASKEAKEQEEKAEREKREAEKRAQEEARKQAQESKIPKIGAGVTHYETINPLLKKAGITPSSIDRRASQSVVTKACNNLKNYYINELRRAKAGSKDREVLQANRAVITAACQAIDHPVKRKQYHEQLEKTAKQKVEKEVEGFKEKRELAERVERAQAVVREKENTLAQVKAVNMPKEQKDEAIARAQADLDFAKEALEDIKAGREPKKPGETDPNFIGKMRGFLTGEINKQKKDADVKIFNLLTPFLSKIKIPPVAFKLFNTDLAMKDVQIIPGPTGGDIRMALGVTGITQVNNFPVKATVYVAQMNDKKIQYSFGLELPESYKLSALFPSFQKLDVLDLPKGKLVASTFAYSDTEGYSVEDGLNFISTMNLAGPLAALGALRKEASKYDFIVVDMAAPIYLQGVIYSGTSASFKSVVPMRLGIDFTKAKKIPSGFSNIIKKITTDDFTIGVVIKPTDQTLNAQSGIQIVLGTQETPLRIQAHGGIDVLSGKINVAGKIPDMLEMGILAIGDVKMEIYIDPAIESVLAFFGVPVSGIALGGRIDLGKPGDTRASLMANGKLSLETKKLADFVMEVEGKNLQFAEIVSLVTRMAEKSGIKGAEIPASILPVMTISRAYGKMAPWDTEIAGDKISAGFQLALDAQLFDKVFGFDVDIKHKDLEFSGSGYMPEIVIKNKGNLILKLSGAQSKSLGMGLPFSVAQSKKPDTSTKGPSVSCSFNAKNPLQGSFSISTLLDIPPIALRTSIDLTIANKAFKADFEAEYAGFTTVFGARIDPKDLMSMVVQFGFKGDFQEFLSKQAKPALESIRREASVKLANVDKKIGELSGELEKLRKDQTRLKSEGVGATQREINKTRANISRINSKIKSLKRECDKAPLIKKTYICPKVGTQIAAQGTALAAQETYLNTLLKPGKQVISGTMNALNAVNAATQKASTAISEAQVFRKAVQGALSGLIKAIDEIGKGASIFKVTEAIGEFSAKELVAGKTPNLKSLRAEMNIPGMGERKLVLRNVQFDFKNPAKSVQNIAKKLIESTKSMFCNPKSAGIQSEYCQEILGAL